MLSHLTDQDCSYNVIYSFSPSIKLIRERCRASLKQFTSCWRWWWTPWRREHPWCPSLRAGCCHCRCQRWWSLSRRQRGPHREPCSRRGLFAAISVPCSKGTRNKRNVLSACLLASLSEIPEPPGVLEWGIVDWLGLYAFVGFGWGDWGVCESRERKKGYLDTYMYLQELKKYILMSLSTSMTHNPIWENSRDLFWYEQVNENSTFRIMMMEKYAIVEMW